MDEAPRCRQQGFAAQPPTRAPWPPTPPSSLIMSIQSDQSSYLWAYKGKYRIFELPRGANRDDYAALVKGTPARCRRTSRTRPRAVALPPVQKCSSTHQPLAVLQRDGQGSIIIADGALHALNFETLIAAGASRPHFGSADGNWRNAASKAHDCRDSTCRGCGQEAAADRQSIMRATNLPLPNAGAEILGTNKALSPRNMWKIMGQRQVRCRSQAAQDTAR